MSFSLHKSENNLWLGQFSSLPKEIAVHAFSTRFGGVSKGAYASLNLGLHVGDELEAVQENRRRFAAALGLRVEDMVAPEQVHGENIYQVTAKDRGRGSLIYDDAIEGTDALMTNEPGIALLFVYADCTPVMLLDVRRRAAAVVHGGWKGTAAALAAKTLRCMGEVYGTQPQDCLAAIGPAIGACCYEVGAELAERFFSAFPVFATRLVQQKAGSFYLDLPLANKLQLMAAGMPEQNIVLSETCTQCNSKVFFSYRADKGKTGRHAALLSLR